MTTPPFPPQHVLPTRPLDIEIEDTDAPRRTHQWTADQISAARCEFFDLAEAHARVEVASRYPLDQVAMRLLVKWGTEQIPLRGELLALSTTREEVADTHGCSPSDATATRKNYVMWLVGRNPKTGGFEKVITKAGGEFIISPDDAPIKAWDFDGTAHAKMKKEMSVYVASRETMVGRHAETGEVWQPLVDDGTTDGGFQNGGDPRFSPNLGGAPEFQQEFQPQRGFPQQYQQPQYGQPQGPQFPMPGMPFQTPGFNPMAGHAPVGPNGEDVYVAQHNVWVDSPARAAKRVQEAAATAREATAKAELDALKAALAQQQATTTALIEGMQKERDADRLRLAEEKKEREAKEERERLAAAHKAELDAIRAQVAETQRKADENATKMLEALQALRNTPATPKGEGTAALIAAVGSAAAPLFTMMQSGRDADKAEAQRRHDLQLAADERKATAEAQRAREDAAERKADRALQLATINAKPGVDPVMAMMQASIDSLKKSLDKAKTEKTPEASKSFLDQFREFNALRKVVTGDAAGASEVDEKLDMEERLLEGGKDIALALAPTLEKFAEKWTREPPKPERKGGWYVGAGGILIATKQVMVNNITVDVPDDVVLLEDGVTMVAHAAYPQLVAGRAAQAERNAQAQAQYQWQQQQQAQQRQLQQTYEQVSAPGYTPPNPMAPAPQPTFAEQPQAPQFAPQPVAQQLPPHGTPTQMPLPLAEATKPTIVNVPDAPPTPPTPAPVEEPSGEDVIVPPFSFDDAPAAAAAQENVSADDDALEA